VIAVFSLALSSRAGSVHDELVARWPHGSTPFTARVHGAGMHPASANAPDPSAPESRFGRRRFLGGVAATTGAVALGHTLLRADFAFADVVTGAGPYGGLRAADANGDPAPGRVHEPCRRTQREHRARHVVPVARRTRRRRLLPHRGRWLGLRVELGGGLRRRRRGCVGVRGGRRRGGGVPDPRRHHPQLRGRAHAVGHVAELRGERVVGAGVGVRPAAAGAGRRAPGDGPLQPRGGDRRPAVGRGVPHRGRAGRTPLPLHARRARRHVVGSAPRGAGLGDLRDVGVHLRGRTRPPVDDHAVRRRRGRLDPRTLDVLHDQGRPPGLGAGARCATPDRPLRRPHHGERAAHRRRQRDGAPRRRATCSWPRTAGTWSCA
jgi:hypothetical protein